MLTHEEMVGLQAEKHQLIDAKEFRTKEEQVLHMMHSAAYARAASFAGGKSVLDVGCNTGYGTDILSRSARRTVGVDVSPEAVRAATQQYGNERIEFQLIDGKQLPFPDASFELVVSCQVVEHVVDYGAYFSEIKRVLTPAGVAIFTTPNAKLRLDPGMKPWTPFHDREFEHMELKSLMSEHFGEARIWGLFAPPELYSVVRDRVARARDAARMTGPGRRRGLRSLIKKFVPAIVIEQTRALLRSRSLATQRTVGSLGDHFGANDFYYREADLDGALDFMAICMVAAPR
jgi:ubiquinone/menaquinone biosynthesis C-methylase UbiE